MIIGIDLGTTYSLCAYFDGKNPQLIPNSQGKFLTASEVHLGEDKSFAVGDCPAGDFPYHFRFFKEFMGTDRVFSGGGECFSAVQLSALVLKQLKEDAERFLNCKVEEAVISVPAYFNDNQRIATKQAGQLAGLGSSRIVNEPSAAALCYQFGYDEATLMVFDFGGGTFDVSMVDCFDNIIEILSISGDNHLGGKTVDQHLGRYFCQEVGLNWSLLEEDGQLLRDMEVIKEKLPQEPQILYEYQGKEFLFTRHLLQDICKPLFHRLKVIMAQAVRDSGKEMGDIDQVILVGGSSRLVGLPQFIEDLMGIKPICTKNPQTVVALGMGYYVGMKSRQSALRELILTDVCPFTLGVGTVTGNQDSRPHVTPLIPRNTTLPASFQSRFVTVSHGQDAIVVNVVQGEGYFVKENLLLANIEFSLPPAPAGEEGVEVCFTYDFNGILQVDIYHEESGTHKSHRILSTEAKHYREEELQEAIDQLNQYRLHCLSGEEHGLLREANGFYGRMGRHEKEILAKLMGEYKLALGNSRVESRKIQRKFRFLLEHMAKWEENTHDFSEESSFRHYLAEQKGDYGVEDFWDIGLDGYPN